MKTLFVSFAALIFAFFVGCQSSITEPVDTQTQNPAVSAEQETYTSKDAASVWPGTIKINDVLCDPVSNTCNTLINGVIKYYIKPIQAGNHIPTAYKVGIYVNAGLRSEFMDPIDPWRVFGMSEDLVYLIPSNQNIYMLEKEFAVSNPRNWGYKLALNFKVSEKDLKLVSMELRKTGAWEPVGDPIF